MSTPASECCEGARGRRVRLVAAVAAALSAAGLASVPGASAAPTLVLSAKSGELHEGRLILRGVGARASYLTGAGSSGTVTAKRLHRRVFLPGRPATATLHVAGHRGGDEPTFRLSRPRYKAARQTVSYRAKPINDKGLPGAGARTAAIAQARAFADSTLTVIPHKTLAAGNWDEGNECRAYINNQMGPGPYKELNVTHYSAWDTDSWKITPQTDNPQTTWAELNDTLYWEDVGGFLRGCSTTVNMTVQAPTGSPVYGTVSVNVTWPWGGDPASTCTVSAGFRCDRADEGGNIMWRVWNAE